MLNFPRWKIISILGVCLFGLWSVMPNFFGRDAVDAFPGWLPNKQINLGLDLQGGAHLLFEVDVNAVIQERLEAMTDEVRGVLRPTDGERIGYTRLRVEDGAVKFDVV